MDSPAAKVSNMSEKPNMLESSKEAKSARIQQARPKYQVFVSSTFIDLHEERQRVTWEILKAGHIPVGMENFSALDDRGWKVINRTLDTTDYYILILAGRYGSIDAELGIGWTEREYRRAIELGIPVLAFVRDKKFISGDQVDTDAKATKLEAFLTDVSTNRLRETWTTGDDLRAKVSLALLKAIAEDQMEGANRPGWYRGKPPDTAPLPSSMPETWSPEHRNYSWIGDLSNPELVGTMSSILAVRQACYEDLWLIQRNPNPLQVRGPSQSECRMFSKAVRTLQDRYGKEFPFDPLDDKEGYSTNPSPGWLLSLCDNVLAFVRRKEDASIQTGHSRLFLTSRS